MDPSDTVPSSVGGWTIIDELGKGGFGDVYRARHNDGREGALKLPNDDDAVEFHQREVANLLRLQTVEHPSAPRVLDCSASGAPHYIVMELIEGEDLESRMAEMTADPNLVLTVARQLAGLMARAHRKELFHRDIKPKNILLGRDRKTGEPRAYLVDWGIARSAHDPATGYPIGTSWILPPGHVDDSEEPQVRDTYALGLLLWCMCTGVTGRNDAIQQGFDFDTIRQQSGGFVATAVHARFQSLITEMTTGSVLSMDEVHRRLEALRWTGRYERRANSSAPALVLFLLDCSTSMRREFQGTDRKRIDILKDAVDEVIDSMGEQSYSASEKYLPRYRIGFITYNAEPRLQLGGIQTISTIMDDDRKPDLQIAKGTCTAKAFEFAYDLLKTECASMKDAHPAPLLIHLTDGEYSDRISPLDVANQIRDLHTPDGPVLIQNIYIGDGMQAIPDLRKWPGVRTLDDLSDSDRGSKFMRELYEMSSPLPELYTLTLGKAFALEAGCRMLFPAGDEEMVAMAFSMATITGFKQ